MTSDPTSISDKIERLAAPPPDAQSASPLRQIARGSAWMVAARWALRGIGLINTIVLARLLQPADFGIVAMAIVMMGFIRMFFEAGQALAVIRHAEPTAEHFDTAWSMSVCAGFLVTLILLAAAPLAGWYYHEPRVVLVVRVLAPLALLDGLTNIGVVAGFRRDLAFDKEFYFFLVRRISSVVVTIPLALIFRNYWALVVGLVGGMALTTAASYWLHPYRPRFRLTKLRELWSFSAWTQFGEIADYLTLQGDQIIVGGLAGSSSMGNYNVISDLAMAPTSELLTPITRTVFPVYATLLREPARLAQSYLDILSLTAILAVSTSAGVALVAPDMIAVFLGPKWVPAAPLAPWLALTAGILGMAFGIKAMVSVTGNARLNAICSWGYAALLISVAIGAGRAWGVEGVAAARTVAAALFLPAMFYVVMLVIPITLRQIAGCLWRPALSALAMTAAVLLSGTGAIAPVALRLACNVGLGAAVFTTALLALWLLAGRPEGAERMIVTQLAQLAGRLGLTPPRRSENARARRVEPDRERRRAAGGRTGG